MNKVLVRAFSLTKLILCILSTSMVSAMEEGHLFGSLDVGDLMRICYVASPIEHCLVSEKSVAKHVEDTMLACMYQFTGHEESRLREDCRRDHAGYVDNMRRCAGSACETIARQWVGERICPRQMIAIPFYGYALRDSAGVMSDLILFCCAVWMVPISSTAFDIQVTVFTFERLRGEQVADPTLALLDALIHIGVTVYGGGPAAMMHDFQQLIPGYVGSLRDAFGRLPFVKRIVDNVHRDIMNEVRRRRADASAPDAR